ncbi:FAD-dependent oxidoreductase [Fodinicurvata sp. EGI_FJ10296]|uniref:NAD(P)/FAD-dependent oxidoreductase n=1 Tax=Fodinicurvata sp. EGI_FJ10296 TaxID=3231908 RepID=UPI00345406D2
MNVVELKAPVAGRSRSWWFQDALQDTQANGAVAPGPSSPLTGEITADVTIVGGGFTGLWTALALSDRAPDVKVVILEADVCGSGASGMNGGKCHGYWGALPGLVGNLGADDALAVCRASSAAQDGIRDFVTSCGVDVWWREDGHAKVSTSPAQDKSLETIVRTAERLGVPDTAVPLDRDAIQAICGVSDYRKAVFFPEGANLHPARLVMALKQEALARGVRIFEKSAVTKVSAGSPGRVETAGGAVVSRDIVLAANTGLAGLRGIRDHVSVFSSYAVMTDPAPEEIDETGWNNGVGLSDLRMFIHYYRKTQDGRVLMGSGSGPIAYGGRDGGDAMSNDARSIERARGGIRRLLPALSEVGIASAWGGAIDVAADRLPFFRTFAGTRIHYACGFSGHGVNPSYIAGQCLTSLILNARDSWSALPFCTRPLPSLPPEPLRYLGGNLVRWGIMTREDAEDRQIRAPLLARAAASLPRVMGLKIGVR